MEKKFDVLNPSCSNKLKLYRTIKFQYSCENWIPNMFKKLRISAQSFPIEIGRYKKIPPDLRTGSLCSIGSVGGEFHYLMKCCHRNLVNLRYK